MPKMLTVTSAVLALLTLAIGALVTPSVARADNFLDHRVSKDTGGIYQAQDAVPVALALLTAGCALWEGTENRLGKTCWEGGESGAASLILSEGLQLITRRESPDTTSDPNQWFKGSKGSFPSTHLSLTTGVVTPFILQYAHDEPWIAALAILPAYEMVARVKAREHWQTDVIAGAALGFSMGAYEHHRSSPLVFYALPGGAFVGFQKSF